MFNRIVKGFGISSRKMLQSVQGYKHKTYLRLFKAAMSFLYRKSAAVVVECSLDSQNQEAAFQRAKKQESI